MIRKNGTPPKSDSWRTDQFILDLVGEAYDPCPYNPRFDNTRDEDGLHTDWLAMSETYMQRVFVNPPYSNVMPWVKKAIKARNKGCVVVMLLKHDSSTRWYKLLHEHGAKFLPIYQRLYHSSKTQASFPSVLVVLS
jgi:hypothetical protein